MDLQDLLKLGKPAPKPPVMPADPGLPSDLLPEPIETWLHHTATLAGVPPVMVTMPYLAGTGAVIGNRLGLHLQPGWIEYPALWIALVALTGTGKTPALLAARQPFNALHTERLTASARSGAPAVPLIITRGTWPQLQQVLPHANGLLLHRDELLGLIRAIDRGSGEVRQHYLSLWSGDVINESNHHIIRHPVVSIIGGIQPLLLFTLRHKQHDGLMERFLPVLAGGSNTQWQIDPPAIPDLNAVLAPLRAIRARSGCTIVPFSPAAHALWATWYNAHVELTRKANPVIHGFYRKYPIHLARLILTIHTLWHPHEPDRPVSRDTVDRAITLIEYLRIQMHRALVFVNQKHPLRTPTESLISRIETVLADHRANDGWIQRSTLAHHLGDPASALVSAALAELVETGRIERREVQGKRGRPAEEIRLQPRHRPRPPSGPNGGNSGLSGPEMPMDSTDLDLSPLSGLVSEVLAAALKSAAMEDPTG